MFSKTKQTTLFLVAICIFTVFSLLSFASCVIEPTDVQGKDLSAPTGLRIENGSLVWNPVSNASKYLVSIDGYEYFSSTNSYSVLNLPDAEHIFKVKAIGNGKEWLDSDYSEELTAITSNGYQAINGYYGQFDDLTKEESFLGYGFDVINSSLFGDQHVKTSFPIFNTSELMNMRLLKVDSKRSYIEEIETSDMDSFMSKWNVNANVNVNWGGKYVGGSVGVSAAYSGELDKSYSQVFHVISFVNQKFYIVMQATLSQYRSILNDGFKEDLYSDMEPSMLFDRYGTHFITSAVMGGRIVSYYKYTGTDESILHDVSAKVSVATRSFFTNVNVGISGGYRSYAEQNHVDIRNNLEVIGGADFGIMSDEDVSNNYLEWEKSLDNHASLMGIKDAGSLVPIWELLDPSLDTRVYSWEYRDENDNVINSGTGNRSAQLQAYFEAYGVNSYNNLMRETGIRELAKPERIDNIRINGQTEIDGEYLVYTGTDNDIAFQVLLDKPGSAASFTKTASITNPSDYASIVKNEDGSLCLRLSSDTPNNSVYQLILSAGGVREQIRVRALGRYTVKFNSNNGSAVESYKNVEYGSQIDEPKAPKKTGYTFLGWYTDPDFAEGTEYQFGRQSVKSDLTLYAKWIRSYSVTFVVGDGATPVPNQTTDETKNYKITRPVSSKTYYTIEGWYKDSEFTELFYFESNVTTDMTLYAKWIPESVNVVFVDEEGAGLKDSTGSTIVSQTTDISKNFRIQNSVSEPYKEGHSFCGWFYNNNSISDVESYGGYLPSNGEITLVAKFVLNKYIINYNVDGELYSSIELDYGSVIPALEKLPEKEGFSFDGWDGLPETVPATDTTVNARFLRNKYRIAYYVDRELMCEEEYLYEAEIVYMKEPEKSGFSFDGWSSYFYVSLPLTMPASDIVLRGEFRRNTYTISYYVDGELWDTQVYSYDAVIDYVSSPVIEGKQFSGWVYSGGELPSKMPALNLTITGTTTKNTYIVSYYVDEELIGSQSYEYGDTISYRSEPTKDGATFSGWVYSKGDLPETMPARNMDIRGSFYKNTHTITVNFEFDKEIEGVVLPDSLVAKEFFGEDYSITVPTVSGYAPDQTTVSGKVTGDETITITYKLQSYKLIANCVFSDSDKASEAIELGEYEYYEPYNIESSDFPIFTGFLPSTETISGTITGEKTVTITYQLQSFSLLANCVFPEYLNKPSETVELGVFKYGESYSLGPSDFPVFEHFVPATTAITGTMIGEKTITITYRYYISEILYSFDESNPGFESISNGNEKTGMVKNVKDHFSETIGKINNGNDAQSLNVPSLDYYDFYGWYTEDGTRVTDGEGIVVSTDIPGLIDDGKWALNGTSVALYSHWAKKSDYSDYTYISKSNGIGTIAGNPTGKYLVVEDLALSKSEWDTLSLITFSGILDGSGHTIGSSDSTYGTDIVETGLTISSYFSVGLFAEIYESGVVRNLTVSGIHIVYDSCHAGHGRLSIGIVCGTNNGTIENVVVNNCYMGICRDSAFVGGITGTNKNIIRNCKVNNLKLGENGDLGGICGAMYETSDARIENCTVSEITLNIYLLWNNRSFGSFVGYQQVGIVSDCSANNVTIMYLGSDQSSQLHNYSIFGAHYYCSLQPAVGWLVGYLGKGASITDSTATYTHKFNNGTSAAISDWNYFENPNSGESKHWFRYNEGNVGWNEN